MSEQRLSFPVRRMLLGSTLTSFGNGLTIPFTLIMLSEVRGIPLRMTGMILAVPAVLALVAGPIGGALVDRSGARVVLRTALVLQVLANVLLSQATTIPIALIAVALLGLGMGPAFPSGNTLLSSHLDGPVAQSRAFGLNFALFNGAFGLGGLVGALVVDVRRPQTFAVLYVVAALTSVAQIALLPAPRTMASAKDSQADAPSYRSVLRDPVLRLVSLVALFSGLTGNATLEAGLPAYCRAVGQIEPRIVGLVFFINTAVVVLGQLAIVRLLRGRRRSTALVASATTWAVAWGMLALLSGLPVSARIALVLSFAALFGLGKIFLAPTLAPLVNALASDRLRGRYNAVSGVSLAIAYIVSPAVSASLIGAGLAHSWLGALVAVCIASAGLSLALRSRLTAEQEGML